MTDHTPMVTNKSQDIRDIISKLAGEEDAHTYNEGYTKCEGGYHREGNGYAHYQFEIDTRGCGCEAKPIRLLPLCMSCLFKVHGQKQVVCRCGISRPLSEVLYKGKLRAA